MTGPVLPDVLAGICAAKIQDVARREAARPLPELERAAMAAPPVRGFAAALRARSEADELALIAEIKKASPSKGLIRADFDPPMLARAYASGGATCLSVLTEEPNFQGSDAYLRAAHDAVELPVLRKDFTLRPYQVVEARAIGADCILLIMAALSEPDALALASLAHDLGLDVLVEVHDVAELERALRLPCELIGVNNRNLKTLTIDLATTEQLAPMIPDDRLLVSESGLGSHADLLRMRAAGAQAFLVGERLMAQADVAAATRRLLGTAA